MSIPRPVSSEVTSGQRLAWALSAVLFLILVWPLLDDLTHQRHLPWGGWVGESAFFLIGLSLALGMASAARDEGSSAIALDLVRRRIFWVGVALLPVAWALLAIAD